METNDLYNSFNKNLYRIGTDTFIRSEDLEPSNIISGSLISTLGQSLGTISTGKTTFNNTENGYILGLDKGVSKFYVGNDTSYLNFDGTTTTIAGDFELIGGTFTGATIQTDTTGERTVITGNDMYLFDDSTGGGGEITGDTATIFFPRTDDEDQKFIIRKRAGKNYDEENVMEFFYENYANPDTSAQSTEWKSPASNKSVDTYESESWTNANYAYATNNYYATASTNNKIHCWYNFSIFVPPAAIILGIEVAIEAKVSSIANSPHLSLYLTKNKNNTVGNGKSTATLTTSDAIYTLGGDDDLWNTTWSASDFGTNFGVTWVGGNVTTDYSIDHIKIKVHYYFSEDFPRENYIFIGRAGDQTIPQIKTDNISSSVNQLYLLEHRNSKNPLWGIVNSSYSGARDIGLLGQGLANGTRNFFHFKDMGTAAVFSDSPDFQLWDTITGNSSGATAYIGTKTDANNYTLVFVNGTFDPDNDNACTTNGAGGGTGTGNLSSITSTEFNLMTGEGGGVTIFGFHSEIAGTEYLGAQMWIDAHNIWTGTNIIPYEDDSYDIGNADHQIKNIYISGNIIGGTYLPLGYFPDDTVLSSADTEKGTDSTSYIKVKEIQIPVSGAFRIKFDLKAYVGRTATGRVYKNGVVIGLQRQNSTTSWVTYEEDFSGFVGGDLIQLYILTSANYAYARNFRICGIATDDFIVNID